MSKSKKMDKISIWKWEGVSSGNVISIAIEDEDRNNIYVGDMNPADFALAVTGKSSISIRRVDGDRDCDNLAFDGRPTNELSGDSEVIEIDSSEINRILDGE